MQDGCRPWGTHLAGKVSQALQPLEGSPCWDLRWDMRLAPLHGPCLPVLMLRQQQIQSELG